VTVGPRRRTRLRTRVVAAAAVSIVAAVVLLGGAPIREPVAHYGPFVMNTKEQLIQAIEDYQAGRLGTIPADQVAPRRFA